MLTDSLLSKTYKKFLIFTIILGIGFRFFNLGYPVYWFDETQTSLRISGYTKSEIAKTAYTSEIIQVGDFLNTYQYPTAEKQFSDVIQALSQHPEHSPLYYLFARFWLQIFPDSVASLRSLSALISLLALPAMYWLCWELFQSQAVSLIAVSLLTISPFHVIYAQEAREYSLWTVTILLSSAALLKALKINQLRSFHWGIYSLTVALGLYTHPFSVFVNIGQGIYVILLYAKKQINQFFDYFTASFIGLLLFLPWLWIVIQNLSNFVDNTKSTGVPREGLPLFWGLNLGRIFFDVNQGTSLLNPTLYFFLFLTIYGIYILIRTTPPKVGIFIITLIGVLGLGLIVPDLLLGGRRSSITRYAIPCYLGIQIAIAYLFTFTIKKYSIWKWILIFILSLGIISSAVQSIHAVWWNKSYAKSRYLPQIAEIINQANNPLIITDEEPGRVLSLSHRLNSTVSLQLIPRGSVPTLSKSNSDKIFLFRPSEELKISLEKNSNIQVKKAYKKGWIWQVITH
ncbi:MAG: glycosyltransferase family 39 protein [Microcoleaceae cyanobacterium]